MKRGIILFLILLCVLGWGAAKMPVQASWVYFSADELIARADLVILGTVEGTVSEQKAGGNWYTDWEVTVEHYLKTDGELDEKILVSTPGAPDKNTATSIDYRLDLKGNEVLLFIETRDQRLEPISPQGVIAMRDGHVFSYDGQEKDRETLVDFLDETERLLPMSDSQSEQYRVTLQHKESVETLNGSNGAIYLIIGIIALTVIAFVLYMKMGKT